MSIIAVDGVVMRYPWGRTDLISRLLGRDTDSDTPEAELWFGAHKNGASPVRGGSQHVTLTDLIAADPALMLGADVAARFNATLPFLLKVLAVNEPLSLQVHPDEHWVETLSVEGDTDQVLADLNPKPEMIVAVGELVAFCGLQPDVDAAAIARSINAAAWDTLAGEIELHGVRTVVANLICADTDRISRLFTALCDALDGGWDEPHADAVRDLTRRYPFDRAVVITVLMRLVMLHDGDALYIPPGVLHCYLYGAGVEVMASSDNVFRVGLTGKRCHPALVARIVLATDEEPVLVAADRDGATTHFLAPTDWFSLSRVRVTPGACRMPAHPTGPSLILTMLGQVTVHTNGTAVALPRGTAAFIPAGVDVTCEGDADVFWARLGAQV